MNFFPRLTASKSAAAAASAHSCQAVTTLVPRGREWTRRNSVVLVLIVACITMCVVAFEQNRTILSQQELIKSLFRDSIELNAMKMHGIKSEPQR